MTEKSLFTANVLKLGGGTALGQLFVVVAAPVITRLYNPMEMGLLGIFMSFIWFLSVGVGLRYEMAIVSVKEKWEAECLLVISLLITLPVSMLSGIVMFVMIKSNTLSYGSLPIWSPVLAIVLLILSGIFTSLRYWFVREGSFKGISQTLIFQGAGRAGVPILLYFLHLGWLGLLAGELAGRIMGIGRLMVDAWPTIKRNLKPFCLESFRITFSRNWKSPAIVLPSTLINALSGMLPVPLVAFLFGIEASGQFFLVQRLSDLPAGLIATSVADVFHPRIAEAHWESPQNVRSILLSVVKQLIFYSSLIYVPVIIISPFIFGFLFGKDWDNTGILMTILSPIFMVGLVVSPVSRLLLVVNRMELKLLYDFISLCAPIFGLWVMHHLNYSFLESLVAYSAIQIFSNLIYFGLIWYASDIRNHSKN
ncbi:MAG: oligosaccharide flippase family protein [Nitrospinae bacterium]|nr:oligosaccharide flippase family protein [Nitrospinota bacterium]